MRRDWVLTGARWLLRGVLYLNWITAAGFAIALLLSFLSTGRIEAQLIAKYGAWIEAGAVIAAVRVMLGLGMAAVVLAHVIVTALLAMIATVERGDPFVAGNARRLSHIGWALLAWQVLDLMFGGIVLRLAALRVDHFDWTPTIGGWIVVVMMFVLARVFAHGAAMRDDLAGTV